MMILNSLSQQGLLGRLLKYRPVVDAVAQSEECLSSQHKEMSQIFQNIHKKKLGVGACACKLSAEEWTGRSLRLVGQRRSITPISPSILIPPLLLLLISPSYSQELVNKPKILFGIWVSLPFKSYQSTSLSPYLIIVIFNFQPTTLFSGFNSSNLSSKLLHQSKSHRSPWLLHP